MSQVAARCSISSSTSRKLSGKRKYSHTQWAITSTGYRWPLYDGDADDTSEPLPGTTNSKIIPGRSANATVPAWEQFTDDGSPRDAETVAKAAAVMLDQLTWWGMTLREGRAARPYSV
ncbi:hypothetical protein [Streptomyces hirsutus]